MEILERIENQIAATGMPLFGITLAAIPCPDTPVILTLHWHAFVKEKLAEAETLLRDQLAGLGHAAVRLQLIVAVQLATARARVLAPEAP